MAIKKVTLPDGTNVVIDEWLHYPLFSTIEIGSNGISGDAANLRAFSYVQGQRVPATTNVPVPNRLADARDTNMVKRGGMNYDEAFILYAITYETFALSDVALAEEENYTAITAIRPIFTAENLRRLQRDLMVELIVGAQQKKPQFRAPFSFLGQSVGAESWSTPLFTGNFVVNLSTGTAGTLDSRNQRRLELPIYIESQQVAFLRVFSPVGSIEGMDQSVRLRFYWDGLKRRPVG